MNEQQFPHEWDDDACCIHCGADGAEIWHLTKFCGYEKVDSDRFCAERERKQRNLQWRNQREVA